MESSNPVFVNDSGNIYNWKRYVEDLRGMGSFESIVIFTKLL